MFGGDYVENNLLLKNYDKIERDNRLLFECLLDSIIEISDTIRWSNDESVDHIQTMIDAVNGDYNTQINKAKKLIKNLKVVTSGEIYKETYEKDIKIAVDDFSSCLSNIHPYFNAKIPLNPKIGGYYKPILITPAQILFMYQIIQKLIPKYHYDGYSDLYTLGHNIKFMSSKIMQSISGYNGDEYEYKILRQNVNERLIYDINNYYGYDNDPEKIRAHELILVKKALNSFKKLLNILSNKKHKRNEITYSMFMRLYRLGFPKNTGGFVEWELEECENPINTSEYDSQLINIEDYENYNYAKLKGLCNQYKFFSFEQLIYFYASYLYNHNEIIIRKCDNCGKFFIAEDRREKYCRNILKDTNGKTCRDVGAINKRNKKYGQDEFCKVNQSIQKKMSYFRKNCKSEVDKCFLTIIYNMWNEKYHVTDKSSKEALLYLKDFKEICLFCFRKYQTKYFDGISKEFHFKFYNLKKQDEKCFCSIADHDSELFQQICHKWNEETVNSIENSLKEIFSPSTGYRENEITQALKEVIKKSIEQTFESILQAHQKAVEIYEKYEDSDYDISEVKELLEQKFKE